MIEMMNDIIILHTNYGIIFKRYILLLIIYNQNRVYNTLFLQRVLLMKCFMIHMVIIRFE